MQTRSGKNYKTGFIELAALCENNRMYRKIFIPHKSVTKLKSWRKRFNNTDVYTSIGLYRRPDYNSKAVYPLFFDIDCDNDLEQARRECIILFHFLQEETGITENDALIHFSGHKGFHVVIPSPVFGSFYTPVFLHINRMLASKAMKYGSGNLDLAIYNHKRIWRIANSINRKSGLYKIRLSYDELLNTGITGIKNIARKPRNFDISNDLQNNNRARNWFREQVKQVKTHQKNINSGKTTFQGRGWRMVPCVKQIEKATLPDGIRHQTYFVLARYYAYLGMHPAEAYERIMEIDKRHPIRDPDSIDRAVKNAQKIPGFAGCNDAILGKYCVKDGCFLFKK